MAPISGERLPVPLLPDVQDKRGSQAYFRSKTDEQIPEENKISHGYPSFNYSFIGA